MSSANGLASRALVMSSFGDVEAGKDCLVEEAALCGVGAEVGVLQARGDDLEGEFERALDVVELKVQAPDDVLGGFASALDAGELFVVEGVGNLLGVVFGERLAFLFVEVAQRLVAAAQLVLADAGHLAYKVWQGALQSS